MLFPIDGLEHLLDIPSTEYEDWYNLKGKPIHIKLLFNYVSKEYILLHPESDWKKGWWMAHLKKTEEELDHEKALYIEKMEKIRNQEIYDNDLL